MSRERTEVPVTITLRDTITGYVRVYADTVFYWGGEFDGGIWDEGNFACDCNRTLFLTNWGQEGPEDLRFAAAHDMEKCGDGRIVVDAIVRRDTGATIYTEADE